MSKPLIGVNLAGGEFGGDKITGRLGYDYIYPSAAQVAYYAACGLKVLRIPFLASRLIRQNAAYMPEIAALMAVIDAAGRHGLTVILDLHEYGMRADGQPYTTSAADLAAFRRVWRILAAQYRSRGHVWFGLMNEPHVQTPAEWVTIANAGIAGIAEVAPAATVLVMGSYWGAADGWLATGNAAAMDGLAHPTTMSVLYEAHQYMDGKGGKPQDGWRAIPGIAPGCLCAMTDWLRVNGKRGFLGEFGFTADPGDMAEGSNTLAFLAANADVWAGATYWAGGLWWAEGRSSYAFSVEPRDFAGAPDRPQMGVLRQFTSPHA